MSKDRLIKTYSSCFTYDHDAAGEIRCVFDDI